MKRPLFSEHRSMYSSNREHPTVIRIHIRMRDPIDPECPAAVERISDDYH